MASDMFRKALTTNELSPLSGVAALALQKVAEDRATFAAKGSATDMYPVFQSLLTSRTYSGPDQTMAVLQAANLSPEAVLDILIPKLAASIGEQWLADEMSWSNVTIVSSRLQSLAWRYIEVLMAEITDDKHTPTALMIVPNGEDHTLGCVLAIGELIREGVNVTGLFGETDEYVVGFAKSRDFDAIGISTSGQGGKERLGPLIEELVACRPHAIHALGGSIKTCNPELQQELCVGTREMSIKMLTSMLHSASNYGRTGPDALASHPDHSVA